MAAIGGCLIKNIFEEFAWRGYLTPRLLDCGLSDWKVYGISGLVWGLWHTAYYLFFLPDKYFESSSRVQMVLIGCVVMMVWAVLFVEIYRVTRSVWPCVILHCMEDAIPTALVTTGGYVEFTRLGSLLFDPITGILSVAILLGLGLYLRKRRMSA